MRRFIVLLAASPILALPTHQAAAAEPVAHQHVTFTETSVEQFAAGQGPCVNYAGTIRENRACDVRIASYLTGPNAGQVHVVGDVDGIVDLLPGTGQPGPAYRGSYREHLNFTGYLGDQGDAPIRNAFHLHAYLTGTDGSRLTLHASGYLIVGPDGQPRATSDRRSCITLG